MCTPNVQIRKDGKGFLVQKGGIWWEIVEHENDYQAVGKDSVGDGDTIMEAVDAALAKLRAVSPQGDKQGAADSGATAPSKY